MTVSQEDILQDFYPTPRELISKMADKITGHPSLVLEPSAGKGDIVSYFSDLDRYSYKQISSNLWEVVENNPDLIAILTAKGLSVVGYDFETFETSKEYDLIIANPPFSKGATHLIKMIELAQKQTFRDCQIICLVNAETIKNPFSNERKHLVRLLTDYQADIEYLTSAFVEAERKTEVETALVTLKVAKHTRQAEYFDNLFEAFKQGVGQSGTGYELAIPSNEVGYRADEIVTLIKAYQEHIRRLKVFAGAWRELETYNDFLKDKKEINNHLLYKAGYRWDDFNSEIEKIRHEYWNRILKADKFRKVLTSNGYQDLQKRISELTILEPTLENVQMILEAVLLNRQNMLKDTLVDLFENLTKYHQSDYSKNIHYYNGWKTNKAYKANHKVILPFRVVSRFYGEWERKGYEKVDFVVRQFLDDVLAVCSLVSPLEKGDWKQVGEYEFENNLIRFKAFKKETVHIWFKHKEILDKINFIAGQDKNWLPTDEEIKSNKEAFDFVKSEFPNLDIVAIGQG